MREGEGGRDRRREGEGERVRGREAGGGAGGGEGGGAGCNLDGVARQLDSQAVSERVRRVRRDDQCFQPGIWDRVGSSFFCILFWPASGMGSGVAEPS